MYTVLNFFFILYYIFNFSDEYFVSNIEKVDSVTLLRKDKLMNGVSWSIRFQQALCTWPCINDLGAGAAQVVILTVNYLITLIMKYSQRPKSKQVWISDV